MSPTWPVRIKIVAFDNAENSIITDGEVLDYMYVVVPEFSSIIASLSFTVLSILIIVRYKNPIFLA